MDCWHIHKLFLLKGSEKCSVWKLFHGNRLQPNLEKTGWYLPLTPTPGSEMFPLLVVDGVALPYSRLCNLGVLLNLWLLFKEQVATVARMPVAQVHLVHQLTWRPFSYSCTRHLMTELLQCTLHGVDLEDIQKLSVTKCNNISTNGHVLVCPWITRQ